MPPCWTRSSTSSLGRAAGSPWRGRSPRTWPRSPGRSALPSTRSWSHERLGLRGRLASDDLLLERALLSDERLLRAAVDRELGPILGAPRNGEELLRTVAAYIASRQNLRTAARELGVGVRTVSYRLTRVEELLGRPLAGEIVLRVTTALLARSLLDPTSPVGVGSDR